MNASSSAGNPRDRKKRSNRTFYLILLGIALVALVLWLLFSVLGSGDAANNNAAVAADTTEAGYVTQADSAANAMSGDGGQDYLYVWAEPQLNVRDAPGLDGKQSGQLPFGDRVRVVGRTDKDFLLYLYTEKENKDRLPVRGYWMEVEYPGAEGQPQRGYLFDGFLSVLPADRMGEINSLDDYYRADWVREKGAGSFSMKYEESEDGHTSTLSISNIDQIEAYYLVRTIFDEFNGKSEDGISIEVDGNNWTFNWPGHTVVISGSGNWSTIEHREE